MTESEIAAIPQNIIDKLVEKFHHFNVDHDWWSSTYESFTEKMSDIGIAVENMHFSGFWSQGDGACFEGHISDWEKFLGSLGYTCPALIALANTEWGFRVMHQGHYYHENCTTFRTVFNTLDCNDCIDDEEFAATWSPYQSELQTAVWMELIKKYKRDDLYEEFVEAFKDHMRDLYEELEREYCGLTSEASILESLNANDMLEDEVKQLTEELENA
jgi:arginyl-tRNA synthetase